MAKHVWIPTLALAVALTAWASSPQANLERTLAAQREVLAERPNDPVALNDLANLLVLVGSMEEAESAYRRAVELAPEEPGVLFNLGLLLQQQRRPDEAAEAFTQVVERQPDDAWARYQLGAARHLQGMEEEAISHYARAFVLNPELAFAEVNPQILENELLTQALIATDRYVREAGQHVPRQYGDGDRIVELMLGESEGDEAAEADGEAQSEGDGASESRYRTSGSGSNWQADEDEGEEGGEEDGPRVISDEDLEPGVSNRGQASAGRAGRGRGNAARGGRTYGSAGVVPSQPPARFRNPLPRSQQRGNAAPAPGSGPRSIPGNVPRYRPSRSSTSSLDLQLLPAPAQVAEPVRG